MTHTSSSRPKVDATSLAFAKIYHKAGTGASLSEFRRLRRLEADLALIQMRVGAIGDIVSFEDERPGEQLSPPS